eukprot:9818462-Lingulodinium_polyedra.AAC.1
MADPSTMADSEDTVEGTGLTLYYVVSQWEREDIGASKKLQIPEGTRNYIGRRKSPTDALQRFS